MARRPTGSIRIDTDGAFLTQGGISRDELRDALPKLAAIRDQVVGADMEMYREGNAPEEMQPLDAGFYPLPEEILESYRQEREQSELGQILKTAARLADSVDRVVVLGIGGSYMGARALMESCCQPYFNELSRAQRGGRPRLYFEGNNVDNDASQGLLRLLGDGSSLDERWAIVVISKSGGTLETAVAFRQFLERLQGSCEAGSLSELVVPVTGASGKLAELSQAIGCQDVFRVPDGVGGRFSILSPVGLLPASILGLDIVALLEGAADMNQHFREAPPEENVVLQYVGVCRLMELQHGAVIRVMNVWSKALEAFGLWYDQLFAESNGKAEQGALPLTVVNTRDLHSRAQQHQEGRRDKFHTHVVVDNWREDSLPVGKTGWNHDGLDDLAERTLPEIMTAAIKGTVQAYHDDGRPSCTIHLPQIHEYFMGQLLQMMMLATVVEGRWMGINPYGQPGVEAYKINMNRNLGR